MIRILTGLSLLCALMLAQSSVRASFLKGDLLSEASDSESAVRLMKTPNGGVQPQAVIDERGRLHLIYFAGEPFAGDIYYVRREAGEDAFSKPIRVKLALTQAEIAEMIGASRETVTRTLADFKSRQIIQLKGSSLVIRNKASLESMVKS